VISIAAPSNADIGRSVTAPKLYASQPADVARIVIAAIAVGYAIFDFPVGAEFFNSAGGEQRSGGLEFGFFAGTQGGSGGLDKTDEGDAEENPRFVALSLDKPFERYRTARRVSAACARSPSAVACANWSVRTTDSSLGATNFSAVSKAWRHRAGGSAPLLAISSPPRPRGGGGGCILTTRPGARRGLVWSSVDIEYAAAPEVPVLDVLAWVVLRDDRMLTVRTRGRDAFYLPGGKREPGESDVAALRREVREVRPTG